MQHPVDLHVGQRIRLRRREAGITQQQLGEAVGIKFQQVQKYETGANRVSASRLWDIARALHVPVYYFFEELSAQNTPTAPKRCAELRQLFGALPEDQQEALLQIARAMIDRGPLPR